MSLRLKMKMEWRFNLIAAVVTRFIFCVCGMKLQGNHHYGNTRFSREQGLELIKLAKLDEIFSLKALGGGVGSHGHGGFVYVAPETNMILLIGGAEDGAPCPPFPSPPLSPVPPPFPPLAHLHAEAHTPPFASKCFIVISREHVEPSP